MGLLISSLFSSNQQQKTRSMQVNFSSQMTHSKPAPQEEAECKEVSRKEPTQQSSPQIPITSKAPPSGPRNGNLIVLNGVEFAELIGNNMFKYNSDRDEWKVFMKFPAEYVLDDVSMVVDQDTKQLYISGQHCEMMIIDLESRCITFRSERSGGRGALVNANGIIHRIDVSEYRIDHDIWSNTTRRWDTIPPTQIATSFALEIQDEIQYISSMEWHCTQFCPPSFPGDFGQISASLIYVRSQNVILMFCAQEWLGEEEDNEMLAGPQYIWRYSLDARDWSYIDLEYDFGDCSFVLTEDEQYVIIVGKPLYETVRGSVPECEYNWIHVYPIGDGNLWPGLHRCCSIVLSDGTVLATSLNGHGSRSVLSSGWIRKQFASQEFVEVKALPLDVTQLIAQYCCKEMIHWICGRGPKTHQKISVTQILADLKR